MKFMLIIVTFLLILFTLSTYFETKFEVVSLRKIQILFN